MKFFIPQISVFTILLLVPVIGFTQVNYKQAGIIQLTIAGTSTLHDWTMTSKEAICNAVIETSADGLPLKVQSLSFSLPAESLKSGKGAMDNNAYHSLKTDRNKNISFQLVSAQVNQKMVQAKGQLTIAGTTKPVDLNASIELKSGNPVFKVIKKIKMSEFNVKPPSFMFGSVKTGDEITITIDVAMVPSKI